MTLLNNMLLAVCLLVTMSSITFCKKRSENKIKGVADIDSYRTLTKKDSLGSEGFITANVLVTCKDGSVEDLKAGDFNLAIAGEYPVCEEGKGSAIDITALSPEMLKKQTCIDWARINTLNVHDRNKAISNISFYQITYDTSDYQIANWFSFKGVSENHISVSVKVSSNSALQSFAALGCDNNLLLYTDQIYKLEKKRIDVLNAWNRQNSEIIRNNDIGFSEDKVYGASDWHGRPDAKPQASWKYGAYQTFLQNNQLCQQKKVKPGGGSDTDKNCPWNKWEDYTNAFSGLTQEHTILIYKNSTWQQYEAHARAQIKRMEVQLNKDIAAHLAKSAEHIANWEDEIAAASQLYFPQIQHLNKLLADLYTTVNQLNNIN